MKRLKILYRKNLKMSPGKLAAQAVHAALGLNEVVTRVYKQPTLEWEQSVVVLGVSDAKFNAIARNEPHIHGAFLTKDAGYTELAPGTETCLAFLEEDPKEKHD